MKKHFLHLLCLLLALTMAGPFFAPAAKGESKTVRVGWYDSPFSTVDASGRRSGYAYEYQQEIAAYTGWTYEYVEDSWPNLMQMLIDGKIDLLSDVSYTGERSETMLFSEHPMGAEEYYIFIAPGNEEIRANDYSTFFDKSVGVNKDTVQEIIFRNWAMKNNIHTEVVELTCTEPESLEMLENGKIDMYVSLDYYGDDLSRAVPVCRIGASDFYFAVTKSRPDILAELNTAMNRIQEANRFYNQQLYFKYFSASSSNHYLDPDELAWLSEHGPIRVGYQDDYLAFCAAQPSTGELTGALKDYLAYAADCLKNARLEFEPVAYPTAEAALDALQNGEVDCMFPANLTDYDGETMGVFLTQPLMRTDVSAVIRASDQKSFAQKEKILVAVNEGNPNYDMFLATNFPDWQAVYYPSTRECLKAVADGKADCLLISSFRYNNIARLCSQYGLITLSTGVEMDYSFAVGEESCALYSILTKTTSVVPDSTVNAALSYYFTEDAKTGLTDYLKDHLGVILAGVIAVLLVFVLLLWRGVRAEKKASAGQRLISATEHDKLSGLYNKSYFFEYADRMYRENPNRPMDLMVLNIERFHALNALNGRTLGDQALCALSEEIRAFLKETEGIGGKSEGDRFAVYCRHLEDHRALFDRLQGKLDALPASTNILLRMGVMPWQAGMDPEAQFEQAHIACGMARGSKERLVVFDDAVREREVMEQRLLNDLRHGLEHHEFEVYYQPKYDIQAETPKLKSAEALVRWRHPELGLIMPVTFIRLFERNGQISKLDKYVWAEAARQISVWRKKYGVVLPVSVNLSRVDMLDPTLNDTLDSLLEEYALEHGAIKLEVTESAYTENAGQVIAVIEALRQKGYEIEMDDFGSGYSSLNMLSSMPIDVLKMDREFVRNIGSSDKDVRLIELVLDIAKYLKVPVIAEGVETEAQFRLLKRLGCEAVQGNYFSVPLPAEEFEKKIIGAAS